MLTQLRLSVGVSAVFMVANNEWTKSSPLEVTILLGIACTCFTFAALQKDSNRHDNAKMLAWSGAAVLAASAFTSLWKSSGADVIFGLILLASSCISAAIAYKTSNREEHQNQEQYRLAGGFR